MNIKLRETLKMFFIEMEKTLRANDYKGGWRDCTIDFLKDKLNEEHHEVLHILDYLQYLEQENISIQQYVRDNIIKECCDNANICMMIADNFGNLGNKKE